MSLCNDEYMDKLEADNKKRRARIADLERRLELYEAMHHKCPVGHEYMATSHEAPCPQCSKADLERRLAEAEWENRSLQESINTLEPQRDAAVDEVDRLRTEYSALWDQGEKFLDNVFPDHDGDMSFDVVREKVADERQAREQAEAERDEARAIRRFYEQKEAEADRRAQQAEAREAGVREALEAVESVCPCCNGTGIGAKVGHAGPAPHHEDCTRCNGTGDVRAPDSKALSTPSASGGDTRLRELEQAHKGKSWDGPPPSGDAVATNKKEGE